MNLGPLSYNLVILFLISQKTDIFDGFWPFIWTPIKFTIFVILTLFWSYEVANMVDYL